MSTLDSLKTSSQHREQADVGALAPERASHDEEKRGHRGHSRWMMIACCIPMLAIAAALVAAGAGFGFLLIALACTAMMAAMMGGMSHGGGDGDAGPR